MSDSSTFSSSSSKPPTSIPHANLHTSESCENSCQQMTESQETNTFSLRTPPVTRRPGTAGAISSGSGLAPGRGPADSDHFHLYCRDFSDGAVMAAGCLQQSSASFSCLEEGFSPDTCSYSSNSDVTPPWDQYNGNNQSLCPEPPAAPVEASCFLSQSNLSYCSSSPLQQVSSRLYPKNDQSNGSRYSLKISQQHQEGTSQPIFPKPIYSYSILIFMALKSSKTGSLPVSEIYSFMTEHFPYFKTAPDGWKNSVRHNLSLNKCFEKVENKNGNSSRKGCLWALNPAKVEKMQEELHKWRRKDPMTVRRSMARPEDLDRLIGDRPDKLRSFPPYTSSALPSRVAPVYSNTSSSCNPFLLRTPCQPIQRPQYSHIQPQQPCYMAVAHPSNSFTLSPLCGQQPATGFPSGGLNSPTAGKMPPVYDSALQAQHSVCPRSMQDFLLDGDASYDIDTLSPSLTDLQLQGNMWEVLRKDSLVSDPQVTTAALSTSSTLQYSHVQTSCLHDTHPVSQMSDVTAVGRCKEEDVDEDPGSRPHCFNGLHPVYSGKESLAAYLTSCTTAISLV
ncbi:forkhead box protein N1 isoform X2 [Echeneis naucrates]|uniref:forkhead box protein N1 isoform X2 n=1 Tax=Echeneis naucrates TaxID=173247 RepID=UPI001113522F|nr:forkhead box protein N1 isoform X2 [Echeneis naucrates]